MLLEMGLLRKGVKVAREGDTIFFPVTKSVGIGHPNVEREVEVPDVTSGSYKDLVRIPPNLRDLLPTSFDVIGDIAIVKVPDEISHFESDVANAIVAAVRSVSVVLADDGVSGPFRVRRLRVLAGPERTETIHREFGLSYRVDVARAYFSPRLGHERWRVASQVRPGEVVADVFSGVGPYAILIAKKREPKVVHAFDANPDAVRYLEENVRRNRVETVRTAQGDGPELLAEVERPDRVILDFPHGPETAYRAAVPLAGNGAMLHVYEILAYAEREARGEALVAIAEELGRKGHLTAWREVHGWSPAKAMFAFDVRLA